MVSYSKQKKTKRIQNLYELARQGKLNPTEFTYKLYKLRIDGKFAILYLNDAFNISLNDAKKLVLNIYYSSNNKWNDDMDNELKKFIDKQNYITEKRRRA